MIVVIATAYQLPAHSTTRPPVGRLPITLGLAPNFGRVGRALAQVGGEISRLSRSGARLASKGSVSALKAAERSSFAFARAGANAVKSMASGVRTAGNYASALEKGFLRNMNRAAAPAKELVGVVKRPLVEIWEAARTGRVTDEVGEAAARTVREEARMAHGVSLSPSTETHALGSGTFATQVDGVSIQPARKIAAERAVSSGRGNVLKGATFENVLESKFSREAKSVFFRPNRRGGLDLVTLEGGDVVLNEAKFANRLQFADFTAITENLHSNIAEVVSNVAKAKNLTRDEKRLVRSTLNSFLLGKSPPNLKIRVLTGKESVGARLQRRLQKSSPLPIEFKNFSP